MRRKRNGINKAVQWPDRESRSCDGRETDRASRGKGLKSPQETALMSAVESAGSSLACALSARPPGFSNAAEDRNEFPRFMNQRVDERRERVAMRHDQPDRMRDFGLDDGDGADPLGEAEDLGELRRHDARPTPGADMGEQKHNRVRLKSWRPGRSAGIFEQMIDDAA